MANTMLDEIISTTTPASLAEYVNANAAQARQVIETQHEHHSLTSKRQATYRGHQIVIHTTYRIEVDGIEVTGHTTVGNDGRVHYHAVPNQNFASAIAMVKRLIDLFPNDFVATSPHDHTHHGG